MNRNGNSGAGRDLQSFFVMRWALCGVPLVDIVMKMICFGIFFVFFLLIWALENDARPTTVRPMGMWHKQRSHKILFQWIRRKLLFFAFAHFLVRHIVKQQNTYTASLQPTHALWRDTMPLCRRLRVRRGYTVEEEEEEVDVWHEIFVIASFLKTKR